MALKIIHVMEFQILFAQILFYNLATFANQLRRKRLASWMLLQHLA